MVDIVGIQPICNLIKQTGLTKFIIYRSGAKTNATPIFECLQSTQNKRTIDTFAEWGNNMLSSNPQNSQEYEIFLFTDLREMEGEDQEPEEEQEETTTKRGKGKKNKCRVNFALCNSVTGAIGNIGADYVKREDLNKMIQEGVERNELIRQNKELEDRLTALEDEDQDEIGGNEDILGRVESILDRVGMFAPKKNQEPAQTTANAELGGVETQTDKAQIMANINKAIKILYQADKDLDKDLLILANISQNNPKQFNFFLSALRKMV